MSTQTISTRWKPRHRPVRAVLRFFIRTVMTVFARVTVEGREHLPDEGPALIVANHFHFADPVVIIRAMPWPLDFIGGKRMPNAPNGVKWLAALWGTFRVRRGGSSRAALESGEAVLSSGGFLGIFPEGGSWASVLRPPRPGAAYLATHTGALVVPVGLDGVTELFTAWRRARRAHIIVRIGQPMGPFPEVERGRAGREKIDSIGRTMMERIAELIPPHRRGVFSEDADVRAAAQQAAAYPWAKARGFENNE